MITATTSPMISPLSARLLAGYRSSGSSEAELSKFMSETKTSSGYAADSEGSTVTPPEVISCRSVAAGETAEHASKRQKIDELHFVASNVKADLEKADRPFPKRKAGCIRGIDTSRVQCIHSKDIINNSPFLTPPSNVNTMDALQSCYNVLFKDSRSHYVAKPRDTTNLNLAGTGSESSLSVSDLESEEDVLSISPLLDCDNRASVEGKVGNPMPNWFIISPSAVSLTLEDAVVLSDKARFITSCAPPFVIFHANKAALKMDDKIRVDPTTVVGSSFGEFLDDGSASRLSLAASAISTAMGRDDVVSLQNGSKCSLHVSPLVSKQMNATKEVTTVSHFLVEVAAEAPRLPHRAASMHGGGLAMGVMG